jgi:hypothetical protein
MIQKFININKFKQIMFEKPKVIEINPPSGGIGGQDRKN